MKAWETEAVTWHQVFYDKSTISESGVEISFGDILREVTVMGVVIITSITELNMGLFC